jgi:hypothetical protein
MPVHGRRERSITNIIAICFLTALSMPTAAQSLGRNVPKMCAQLLKEGWTAPTDPLTNKPGKAEMNVPGVMYICMVEHELPTTGDGHAPSLQALLSKDTEASVILSASVWCEVDQAATLDALAKQVERSLAVADIKAPDGVLAAIRAAKQTKVSADGLSFDVLPISVDPDACSRVPADELGAVLMKVDVSVKG